MYYYFISDLSGHLIVKSKGFYSKSPSRLNVTKLNTLKHTAAAALYLVCTLTRCFLPAAAFPGSLGGLFMDPEDSATANPAEDISKWSVEDVCGFISSLAGCAEYTQVRL